MGQLHVRPHAMTGDAVKMTMTDLLLLEAPYVAVVT